MSVKPVRMPAHAVEIAVSHIARVVYVRNLKAASSSITEWLMRYANAELLCRTGRNGTFTPDAGNGSCCLWPNAVGLLSTRCLGLEHSDYFVFSFVRNPISKFEAGVQQTWVQSPLWRRYSGEALLNQLLNQQLRQPAWLAQDEHLQTSSWRLSGATRNGTTLRLDFVGKLESFSADWSRLRNAWPPLGNLSSEPPGQLNRGKAMSRGPLPAGRPCTHYVDQSRSCMAYQESTHGSTLSPAAICSMCRSWMFGIDFVRFGYTHLCPSNCTTPDPGQAHRRAPTGGAGGGAWGGCSRVACGVWRGSFMHTSYRNMRILITIMRSTALCSFFEVVFTPAGTGALTAQGSAPSDKVA